MYRSRNMLILKVYHFTSPLLQTKLYQKRMVQTCILLQNKTCSEIQPYKIQFRAAALQLHKLTSEASGHEERQKGLP